MGRLSHEEQIAAIAKASPDVEVLERITNNTAKVLCRCKNCNYEWSTSPSSLKHKCGCPECGKLRAAQRHTLSHEEQIAVIAKASPDVEVLGVIVNGSKKTLCRCKVCGNEWSATPNTLKSGCGCPKCANFKKTLSHEEYLAAIAKVNPNIEILGEIVGCDTKVSCRCKVCGNEWMARPVTLKRGYGCPKCGRAKGAQKRRLSHEEQIAAITKVNPDIEILERITNNSIKVLCRCKVCNNKWSAAPNTLKHGCGCPKCGYLKLRLSHDEQMAVIAKTNPDVEVLGRIINSTTKVLCRCKVCGNEWSSLPYNLRIGMGCSKCAVLKRTFSHEKVVADIEKVNTNIKVLGKIVNVTTKVLCRCKVCGNEWMARPYSLKKGTGCPKCALFNMSQKKAMSHKEQVAAIAKVNPNIEILGEIVNNRTKVLCRCKVCGHEWMNSPCFLKRNGCPICTGRGLFSHKECKLYIMVDDLELPTQMKVGVSVRENERRKQILKSAHKAGIRIPDLHIVKTFEGPTEKIHNLEHWIHKTLSDYKIDFPVKFDGSCEFFHYRPEVFEVAEHGYKDIVCCQ